MSSNYETTKILETKNISSILWEDCYSNEDLLRLYNSFKLFANEWFIDNEGIDSSVYDGMSFGSAISVFLAYDIETWVRIFYLFEHLASKKVHTKFYTLNKDYFPQQVYEFVDHINSKYKSSINIISLEEIDHGIEPSVTKIVKQKRLLNPLIRAEKFKSIWLLNLINNIFRNVKKEKKRCLVLRIRNSDEYLQTFLTSSREFKNIRLFFDPHFFIHRRLFFYNLIYNKLSLCFINHRKSIEDKLHLDHFIKHLLETAEDSLDKIEFLSDESKKYFKTIFLNYIEKAVHEQINQYLYLSELIHKYEINSTLCDGPDTPETFYCKHLMDKVDGVSYFLSHGLMGRKDKKLDKGREKIAHRYFYYSESERERFSEQYNIPKDKFYPVSFLGKNPCTSVINGHHNNRVLILLDNFQVSLISRINYFRYFTELYELMITLGFENISIRLHGAFFNYYYKDFVDESIRNTYFYSAPVQKQNDKPLKSIIGKYDIIIGPLTSCILEAMWAKVFFIPYIPNYFPAETKDEIVNIQWFPGLHPKPITDIKELSNTLQGFIDSPKSEHSKYLNSVNEVGNCEHPVASLWSVINSTCN